MHHGTTLGQCDCSHGFQKQQFHDIDSFVGEPLPIGLQWLTIRIERVSHPTNRSFHTHKRLRQQSGAMFCSWCKFLCCIHANDSQHDFFPVVKTNRPRDTLAIVCFSRDSAQHVHTVPCRSTSRWLLQGGTTGRTPSRSCKRAVCCCCKYIVHSISEGGISLSLSFALV